MPCSNQLLIRLQIYNTQILAGDRLSTPTFYCEITKHIHLVLASRLAVCLLSIWSSKTKFCRQKLSCILAILLRHARPRACENCQAAYGVMAALLACNNAVCIHVCRYWTNKHKLLRARKIPDLGHMVMKLLLFFKKWRDLFGTHCARKNVSKKRVLTCVVLLVGLTGVWRTV